MERNYVHLFPVPPFGANSMLVYFYICVAYIGRDKPLLTVVYVGVRSYSSGPGSHTIS